MADARQLWRIEREGAVTAVGTRAWQCAASWVGGTRRFRRTTDETIAPVPITRAACAEIGADHQGPARLASLLGAAVADMLASSGPLPPIHRILLALPDDLDPEQDGQFWIRVRAGLARYGHGDPLAGVPWKTFRFGNAAAHLALASLYVGEAAPQGPVLLAGVDSLLDSSRLQREYAARRLMAEDHTDGYIPGEAAGCLLLVPTGTTRHADRRHLVLHPPAIASNSAGHLREGHEPDASALTEALRGALARAGWQGRHVACGLSDFDGSAWRASAQATALARATEGFGARPWEPASVTGQIGAASGAVHWALAAQRLRHDPDPPNSILSWALDPGCPAAAVALERTLAR